MAAGLHTTGDGWTLTAVIDQHERRVAGRWLAIWKSPTGAGSIHAQLPLDTGSTTRDEAIAYTVANRPAWPGVTRLTAAR